ncbi:hypothetical protein AO825_14020 [Pectobacterium brasiliense]|uniref:hypothetical protein n=1 Tax=Pectobacterium brasiliense TaxID=180957 RepID=UPI0001A434B1|nr:hypothetical protein [Pectobacterium brasiliense]KGA25233.1 hypothetical protein KS44_00120 [Pectobacterium brasiliense]KRF61322.1 hypothetical protein AO825_14020 [Pectobacterium brasiliense]MBN3186358.1 hypothetical protein [Pectobacterium brasiliense]QHG27168.1 hypothetical protein GT391_03380 [Pectobacterium brasiliense]
MLQISSGVFFDADKIERHEGTFVFYSNVDVFFSLENNSPFFKLKKISHDGVNCYLVDYNLLTEKPEKIEAGVVVRAGDQDYVQQFILLWEFYFNCVARLEKESVKKICAQLNFNKNHSKIALEVAPYLVEINRNVSQNTANGFCDFLKNVVSIERAGFTSVIAALKIISDTKESLSTNFDLAYSMLVYALESLSQRNARYQSHWEDYDQNTKGKLEEIFIDIPSEISDKIKNVLVDEKQFKIEKRFKSFIVNNIEDDFFYETERFPIRRSFLDRALDNLYKMRSSFVHELKPLDVMISQAHNPMADCLVRFGEPYFSYSGLLRLLSHVIKNFCRKNTSKTKETVNWLMETSSTIIGEMSAQYWVWNPVSFTDKAVGKWFSEYLNMLNSNQVVDLQKIMDKIEIIFDQSKKEFKDGLLHFYYLYNLIHNEHKVGWRDFAEKRHCFLKDSIYWYACCSYLYNSLGNEFNATVGVDTLKLFTSCFNDYDKNKFKKNRFNLPAMTEVAMLVRAANQYYRIGMYENYKLMTNRALREISSVKKVFDYIKARLTNAQHIDLIECFSLYREKEG